MKCKDLFISSLETLLFSWGGEAPSEAIWSFNEILDWLEEEYNISLIRLKEDLSNSEEVLNLIKQTEFSPL